MNRHDKHILEFGEEEFLSFFTQPDKLNAKYDNKEWTIEDISLVRETGKVTVVLRQRRITY